MIAIVPDWFAPEALRRLEMARTLLDTARVAIHVTSLPPLAATALASLASSLGPRLPSAGLLASALPGPLRAAAPDHVAGQRHRPQAPGAEHRPARHEPDPRQRVRRLLAPAARRPQDPVRASRRSRCRGSCAPAGWRSPPATATSSGSPARSTRRSATSRSCASSRRPAARTTGARARSSRRSSCPADPDGLAQRAAAVRRRLGLPLVRRADRPLAVPAVRPPRPPAQTARAASTGRSQVGRGLLARRAASFGSIAHLGVVEVAAPVAGLDAGELDPRRELRRRRRPRTSAGTSASAASPRPVGARRRPTPSSAASLTVRSDAVSSARGLDADGAAHVDDPDLARVELGGDLRARRRASGRGSSLERRALVAGGLRRPVDAPDRAWPGSRGPDVVEHAAARRARAPASTTRAAASSTRTPCPSAPAPASAPGHSAAGSPSSGRPAPAGRRCRRGPWPVLIARSPRG